MASEQLRADLEITPLVSPYVAADDETWYVIDITPKHNPEFVVYPNQSPTQNTLINAIAELERRQPFANRFLLFGGRFWQWKFMAVLGAAAPYDRTRCGFGEATESARNGDL